MEWYGCKVVIGCTQFILVPILISVERQSMQLLASPEDMKENSNQVTSRHIIDGFVRLNKLFHELGL